MFNEQREAQRKVLKVKAQVAPLGLAPMTARTVDVSGSGMCISAPDPLKIGTTAEISFDIFIDGKPNSIRTRSRVTFCILSGAEFRIGFQFVTIDLSAMSALARYLR